MKRLTSALMIGACCGLSVINAQEAKKREPKKADKVEITVQGTAAKANLLRALEGGEDFQDVFNFPVPPMPPMPPMEPTTFNFISSEFGFDRGITKNAAYSAEAVTETIQMLADGNRIVRRTSANVFRDAEGRTRREQSVPAAIGVFSAGDDANTSTRRIYINDPVSGANFVLNPNERKAHKQLSFSFGFDKGHKELGEAGKRLDEVKQQLEKHQKVIAVASANGGGFATSTNTATPDGQTKRVVITTTRDGVTTTQTYEGEEAEKALGKLRTELKVATPNYKTEDLGTQNVEGVEARGTRTTRVIAAGEIGNERPIELVSERWYSPDLQLTVMSKRSDPRTGETIYRLTNINRAAPDAALFQVPSDYTVTDSPSFNVRTMRPMSVQPMRREKKQ